MITHVHPDNYYPPVAPDSYDFGFSERQYKFVDPQGNNRSIMQDCYDDVPLESITSGPCMMRFQASACQIAAWKLAIIRGKITRRKANKIIREWVIWGGLFK